MKLKLLSLITLLSFISLLPATGAADEPAEPNPRPLDELAEAVEATANGTFFRDSPHMVIPFIDPWNNVDERAHADSWQGIVDPTDPQKQRLWEEFQRKVADMDLRAIQTTIPSDVFASADNVEPLADPDNPETPPVDILFVIDDGSNMKTFEDPPMRAEEKKRWEEFKQRVADMNFNKISVRIRFALNEDGQLTCWHSGVHGSLDCEDMINRMFSWIKKAEEQDSLTVSSTEQLVQDFILRELRDIETVEKMRARMEQFMKEHDLSGFAVVATNMSIISTPVETQDQ